MDKQQLVLVIVIVIVYSTLLYCLFVHQTEYTKKDLEKIHKTLEYGLSVVHDLFAKENIWYVIAFGTLLGAMRHRDFIPWDDDADLLIYRKDLYRILDLEPKFLRLGIRMKLNWKTLQLYFDSDMHPHAAPTWIDLMIIDEKDGKVIRCAQPFESECLPEPEYVRWWWREYNFPIEWIKERTLYLLGNQKVWGPKNAQSLLYHWYGDNCLTKCKTPDFDHFTFKWITPKTRTCGDLPIPQIKTPPK